MFPDSPHQQRVVNVVKGNHDTLPIPKTFPKRSPSSAGATRLKAGLCKSCGARSVAVSFTSY
jgi:hypothetical protein